MPRKQYPSDMTPKTMLRFYGGLYEVAKIEATRAKRSLNAEINFRLEQAYGLNAADYSPLSIISDGDNTEAAGEQIGVQAPAAKNKTDVEASIC